MIISELVDTKKTQQRHGYALALLALYLLTNSQHSYRESVFTSAGITKATIALQDRNLSYRVHY